jgi:hypothetical protein
MLDTTSCSSMHDLFVLLYFTRRVFNEINVLLKKTYSVVKHFIVVDRKLVFKGAKPVIVFATTMLYFITIISKGCRGRDRMVVGFMTTYAISAYHH